MVIFAPLLLPLAHATSSTGWPVVWRDEFDGRAGTRPSATNWTAETGGDGWGNGELEHYTNRPENARLDGEGHLVIEARNETFGNRHYTSARLITSRTFKRTYGRFEARIRLPTGKGLWPAFWMLGTSAATEGWPACGEIDVMEFLGHEPNQVHGTIHGPCYSGGDGIGGAWTLPDGKSFSDGFHDFAVEWEPGIIRWLVDGAEYRRTTTDDLHGRTWVFDQSFFILLNLAVGGNWPGNPDAKTQFPARMIVDWVRVSADPNFPGPTTGPRPKAGSFTPPTHVIPGIIEAEHFDVGGEGVGYHDTDAFNQGCELRRGEGVDLERCADSGTGFDVAWTAPGEWLAYTVNVATRGAYRLNARVASQDAGGTFHLESAGRHLTESLRIPDTGGWQTWTTVTAKVTLPAGRQTLKLVFDAPGAGDGCGNLNRLAFEKP